MERRDSSHPYGRRKTDGEPSIHPYRWAGLAVWIVAFTIFTLYVWQEVGTSRRESCQRTYHAMVEVFRPFFPKDPNTWTKKEQRQFAKLVRITNGFADRCSQQTGLFHNR